MRNVGGDNIWSSPFDCNVNTKLVCERIKLYIDCKSLNFKSCNNGWSELISTEWDLTCTNLRKINIHYTDVFWKLQLKHKKQETFMLTCLKNSLQWGQ